VTADDLPAFGCDPTQFGYLCSFTVYVDLSHAQNGSTVTGRLIATAWRPGQAQTREVPFSMTVQAGTTTTSTPVQANFSFPPCRGAAPPASTAFAAVQQPNGAASTPVTFGTLSPC
jgi:hypothetical protein